MERRAGRQDRQQPGKRRPVAWGAPQRPRFVIGCTALAAACLLFPPAIFAGTLYLTSPAAYVNDGDTFEADLDGNGRLEFPRERVRLLYVDTPELTESHKGQDVPRGMAARAFLERALADPPFTVRIPRTRPSDKFGRTLAVVEAGGTVVNLELIRMGHSYFDTRFGFPRDYSRYASAEAEAFTAGRGIWSDAASRKAYLARLRRESKTPRSPANPAFAPGPHVAGYFDPASLLNRFVRVGGRLKERRFFSKGARLLILVAPEGHRQLRVYVRARLAFRLGVDRWPIDAPLLLDGFIKLYRGRPELKLHYGAPAKPS